MSDPPPSQSQGSGGQSQRSGGQSQGSHTQSQSSGREEKEWKLKGFHMEKKVVSSSW